MEKKYLSIPVLLIFLLGTFNVKAQEYNKPVVFNHTETARPGEVIGLQGQGFAKNVTVQLMRVKNGAEDLTPRLQLAILTASDTYVASIIPDDIPEGLYAVWVSDGDQSSEPVLINRARTMIGEFDEIMPGTVFRIFGRNLWMKGHKTLVKLIHRETNTVTEAKSEGDSPYEITITAPDSLKPGLYTLLVNNGTGGKYGDYLFETPLLVKEKVKDSFDLNVPWGADFNFSDNLYNVMKDSRLSHVAKGDGQANDRNAIQEAIDKASADGGGVVYIPAGTYKLLYSSGCGITMKSRVVLKGDGPGKTMIKYGYGTSFGTERVKASYGWTLGWPDSRIEGMGMVWPGFITTSGLLDLSFINVNESGSFVHTIKNMPEGGNKIVLKNCAFDFNTGWGLAMVNIDKLLMDGCEVKITGTDVRGINAPMRTWPLDFKNSGNYIVRNNRICYNAGRFGMNGCHHAIFENNYFIRNGDHQSKGETGGLNLDYVKDIVIQKNKFLVTGKTIRNSNQGETILSQGGNPHQQTFGVITEAGESFIKDNEQEWQDFTDRVSTDWQYAVHPMNYIIAIVDGAGTGQWRTITGNNDTILTVDKPWEVIPAKGGKYVITQWSVYRALIKDNILKDNHQGIMLYCGGSDVAIVGNELTNSGGIYLRSDQRTLNKRYNLTWNVSVIDNMVINTNGFRSAHVAMYHVKTRNDNSEIFGTGTLGIEIRRNQVQASVPNVGKAGGSSGLGAEGFFNLVQCGKQNLSVCNPKSIAILGTIMENNTAVNTINAYQISESAFNTVIIPGKTENVENLVTGTADDSGTYIQLE